MTTEMQTTTGITVFIHGFTEDQITGMVAEYRQQFPNDPKSDEELRPAAVNELIVRKYSTPPP